jgi:transposase
MPEPVPPGQNFLGCDVGKQSIVIFDTATGQTSTVKNTAPALTAFLKACSPDSLVVCEATGGYETTLLDACLAEGLKAHRADAAKVKAFIRSLGISGKTDAIDAQALARYGRERQHSLPLWQKPTPALRELQALVQRRRDLIALRVAETNRAKAPDIASLPVVQKMVNSMIASIKAQIAQVDKLIAATIANAADLAGRYKTLRTITGIGPASAAALIALMPELGAMNRRQAASLAGLAPHPRQSGASDAYRATRGGRKDLKSALFMAAMVAAKHNKTIKIFYQRLIQNGKKPIVALTAVMRKLIIISNGKIKSANLVQES